MQLRYIVPRRQIFVLVSPLTSWNLGMEFFHTLYVYIYIFLINLRAFYWYYYCIYGTVRISIYTLSPNLSAARKVKLFLSMPERHTGEIEVKLHSFLILALDECEWSTSHTTCFTPEIRRLAPIEQEGEWAPWPVWAVWSREKNYCRCQESNLRSSSLYPSHRNQVPYAHKIWHSHFN